MGSSPPSSSATDNNNKLTINVVEIIAKDGYNDNVLNKQSLVSNYNNNNNKTNNNKINNKNNNNNRNNNNPNNQEFTTSVEQMKVTFILIQQFSQRNDLFKQRSKQTIMQLNNALNSLKKNQLLSTIQFKRLQKTQHLVTNNKRNNKSPINNKNDNNNINTIDNNKNQRYHYKKAPTKRSQLGVREKRTQSSINVSSVASTYINQKNVLRSDQRQGNKLLQRHHTINGQGDDNQINIIQLLMMKKKLNKINNTNTSNNIQKHQQIRSQNGYRNNQHNVFDIQQQQQINNIKQHKNNNNQYQYHQNLIVNNRNKKKKSKYVRSQKFIANKLTTDGSGKQWDDSVIVEDGYNYHHNG